MTQVSIHSKGLSPRKVNEAIEQGKLTLVSIHSKGLSPRKAFYDCFFVLVKVVSIHSKGLSPRKAGLAPAAPAHLKSFNSLQRLEPSESFIAAIALQSLGTFQFTPKA